MTFKYHRTEDRMIISFALPTGERRTFWITRHQWLLLILRLSEHEELPTEFEGMADKKDENERHNSTSFSNSAYGNKGLENNLERSDKEGKLQTSDVPIDAYLIVKKIGLVKTGAGLRISFVASEAHEDQSKGLSDKINLNLTAKERPVFLEALISKARQAGWDLEAGLQRMRANQRKNKAKAKPVMH